jgi:hypothetical protein
MVDRRAEESVFRSVSNSERAGVAKIGEVSSSKNCSPFETWRAGPSSTNSREIYVARPLTMLFKPHSTMADQDEEMQDNTSSHDEDNAKQSSSDVELEGKYKLNEKEW